MAANMSMHLKFARCLHVITYIILTATLQVGLLSPFYSYENRGAERLSNSPRTHGWRVDWDWNIGFQIRILSVTAPLHAASGPPAFPNPQVHGRPSLTGMLMPSDLHIASGSVLRETSLTCSRRSSPTPSAHPGDCLHLLSHLSFAALITI